MDRILIILKKENSPGASSAPALGLNTIIFKHVCWYMQQTQVSVYRTIGPLVSVLEGLEMPFIGPQVQGLEPDLTQLKKSMKSVDSDLSKVKRMAVFH